MSVDVIFNLTPCSVCSVRRAVLFDHLADKALNIYFPPDRKHDFKPRDSRACQTESELNSD